jgi:hypothetical protein
MLGVSVSTEELPGVFLIDLPEHELVQRPDDPTIPHLLLDESAETELISRGQYREACRSRLRRKHLYRIWLAALQRRKLEIHDARLRSHRFPFEKVLGFDFRISRGLLLLRLAGFLHFSGISKRLDRNAVEAARRMANLAELRTY